MTGLIPTPAPRTGRPGRGATRPLLAAAAAAAALALGVSHHGLADPGTYAPGAGLSGTPHDLSSLGVDFNLSSITQDPKLKVCVFCHAPNDTAGSEAPSSNKPLWNQSLEAVASRYRMYENGPGAPRLGPGASQAVTMGMTPGPVSLVCLSCHDGSSASNAHGNRAALTVASGNVRVVVPQSSGQDSYLGNHHPIGFDYDSVRVADSGIRNAETRLTSTSSIRDHLSGDAMGTGSRLECTTCHSVHNTMNGGEKLLWRSNRNSELCLTCHAKGDYTAP